ncbi:MAG: DUF1207 domain-containing protein [Pirellulales bacterium]|nr:DUF1207 domain-containing protein [Pirellulales bacterium]
MSSNKILISLFAMTLLGSCRTIGAEVQELPSLGFETESWIPSQVGASEVPSDRFFLDSGTTVTSPHIWQWQILPDGLIWHSYAAGVHEPRVSGVVYGNQGEEAMFDVTLGGRLGVLRYGTTNSRWPDGFQFDLEGAAFPRLNLDENWDLDLADYRFGVPFSYGAGSWRTKFAYYHLSSHMGDEYALRNPGSLNSRINYSRDAMVLGVSYYPISLSAPDPWLRLYAEADWAFHFDDGNKPWEFQFGVDCMPIGPTGIRGTPFFAVNGHIREAVDFGGNVVAQIGWCWQGDSGRALRMGFHYYNGKSNQFEFYNRFEQHMGFGIWYDQ